MRRTRAAARRAPRRPCARSLQRGRGIRASLGALSHLEHDRTTVVLNKARPDIDQAAIERRFREQRLHRSVTIPYDERLRVMLDSGTYSLESLGRRTRAAVKLLGLAVGEQLL